MISEIHEPEPANPHTISAPGPQTDCLKDKDFNVKGKGDFNSEYRVPEQI